MFTNCKIWLRNKDTTSSNMFKETNNILNLLLWSLHHSHDIRRESSSIKKPSMIVIRIVQLAGGVKLWLLLGKKKMDATCRFPLNSFVGEQLPEMEKSVHAKFKQQAFPPFVTHFTAPVGCILAWRMTVWPGTIIVPLLLDFEWS